MSTYVLNNAAAEAGVRFNELETLYDPVTHRQLDAAGVAPGWRCWEIGTGGGSVALELAQRATPGGQVFATDVDIRWTPLRVRMVATVLTHNVVTDDPPARDLDLIHMRLVASHLPEWNQVLPKLVDALRPGGWLLVEELDPMHPYQPDPRDDRDNLTNQVGDAFTAVLGSRGGNPNLGRTLHHQLTATGLTEVVNEGTLVAATGGSPAARLMRANTEQMAEQLLEHSTLTQRELNTYVTALNDPTTGFFMPTFFAARGRR